MQICCFITTRNKKGRVGEANKLVASKLRVLKKATKKDHRLMVFFISYLRFNLPEIIPFPISIPIVISATVQPISILQGPHPTS